MKLLSVAIPCYNSAAYMSHAIESLLIGRDDVEIIVVDDGSTKDNTLEIAKSYEEKYPTIVKAVHQENGGHGEAVNTGLKNATGLYFKVVDSDDWVDEEAYREVLSTLRMLVDGPDKVDMLIANYVYEKEGQKHKKVMKYDDVIPVRKVFTWDDAKNFKKGQYILMHSVIYRTSLLRECGLVLPKHTFYVDNIFVYVPLPYVKKMYYLDVDFYRYFIGRDDQSVNEAVMIKRIDQQIRVNKIMVEAVDLFRIKNKKLQRYMFNYLEIITVISTIMLIRSGTEENLEKKRELWTYLKDYDIRLFHKLRNGIMGRVMNLPGRAGRKISVAAYKISQKVVGFN
ncbi:MAG: glycosyltransferase family 2 protein [Lachnospiraceae bacterium]|nr:glycosyltransferase family 2 protein [Lachnospiraceae bacterium]